MVATGPFLIKFWWRMRPEIPHRLFGNQITRIIAVIRKCSNRTDLDCEACLRFFRLIVHIFLWSNSEIFTNLSLRKYYVCIEVMLFFISVFGAVKYRWICEV